MCVLADNIIMYLQPIIIDIPTHRHINLEIVSV